MHGSIFFGIIQVSAPHLIYFMRFNSPILHNETIMNKHPKKHPQKRV